MKFKIVKEALTTDQGVTAICKKYGVPTSVFYRWQELFLDGAKESMERGKNAPSNAELRRISQLEQENKKLKDVVAEITSENIDFKKKFSE
jgi:transposase-like protein